MRVNTLRITAAAATLLGAIGLGAPAALAAPSCTNCSGSSNIGVGATVPSALTLTVTGSIAFGNIVPGQTRPVGGIDNGFYWTPIPPTPGDPWATGFLGHTGTEQVDINVVSNDGAGYYVTETLNGPMTAPGVTQTIPDSDIFAWLDNPSANSNPYVFSGLAGAPAGVTNGADSGIFAKSTALTGSGGDNYPLALGLSTPAVLPAGNYSTSLTMLALGN